MKDLIIFLNESLNEAEETIKSEKDFRAAAKAKFEEVYGDDLDEKKMKKTIDGLLDDNQDLVDKGEWGKLIGMLNKSFAPKSTNEGLLDAKAIATGTNNAQDIDQLPKDKRMARFAQDINDVFDAAGTPLTTSKIVDAPEYGPKAKKVVTKANHVPAYNELKTVMRSKKYDSFVEKYPDIASALILKLYPSKANDSLDTADLVSMFTELFG